MSQHIIIYSTFETEKQAADIGKQLIEQKLCACVNIFPKIHSISMWKGKMHETTEASMFIKTKKELYQDAEDELRRLHPYENPCVIAWDLTGGSTDFLDWINQNTINS